MNDSSKRSNTLATGLAMFSMFFGAGNVVFPLALGQYAQDQNIYAILGLLITAVGVPFLGLMAMTLFNGNYTYFFERIGKIPGYLLTLCIMALIGPFGAIPRCIALSFSTIKLYLPGMSLSLFSFISCILIYIFTFRKNNIINILGYILTPFLLACLAFIIIKGFLISPEAPHTILPPLTTFLYGLKEGYQTMDLLGAFFFSSIVLACLEKDVNPNDRKTYKRLIFLTLKASFIGAFLLGLMYVGFSYLAAFNSVSLENVKKDELLGTVAHHILGPYASFFASLAVALACLTTAIAVSAVFAEFLQKKVMFETLSYQSSLLLTLTLSFCISTLEFNGIVAFIAPILHVCYPALIVLCILNIFYKLYHFKPVKTPFFATFIISLISYFM